MLNDRCPRGRSLDRHTGEEIALKHPAVQVFEQKTKAPEPKAPEVNASTEKRSEGKASAAKAPDRKTPAAPPPVPPYLKLSLKGRGATGAG